MSDYKNLSFRLVDIGLDIRNASDKVPEGKWTILENVQSLQEGAIATRAGTTLLHTITDDKGNPLEIHSLRRLSPQPLAAPSAQNRDITIIGAEDQLFRNTSQGLFSSMDWSGNPVSVVPFRPRVSSLNWAYVADSLKMQKINSNGQEYKWGITKPLVPTFFGSSLSGGIAVAGNLNSSAAGASLYDWRYTYYSTKTGAESNPSDTVSPGAAVVNARAMIGVSASTDPQVDQIRLYRRGGTNGTSKWRLAVTGPNETRLMEDNQADSAIALAELLNLTNDVPFTSVGGDEQILTEVPMPYVAGPFIGKYMVACGDANRPGHVYWTNPEAPDSASPANNLQVTSPQEPLIAALMYASQPFLFTRDNLYKLDYGGPTALPTFVSRKTGCGRGICAPWAFDIGPFIFFVSQDGIYATDGENRAECITEESIRPIFSGQTIAFSSTAAQGTFKAIDFAQTRYIRLHYIGQELHFLYKDTSGDLQHLIYHTLYKRWKSRSSPAMNTTVLYGVENSPSLKILYGGTNGEVHINANTVITDDGETLTSKARTGLLDGGIPHTVKEYGNYILDVDLGTGTLVVTPYVLQKMPLFVGSKAIPTVPEALASQTLTANTYGRGRQKLSFSLSDTYAYAIAFHFEWTGDTKIYQFELLWREDEEEIRHWEFPPTSHGLSGWQHVRDLYVTLRSLADVTLTLGVDGDLETFTIPSTNGEKLKRLVHLSPRKGKLFHYKLDSSERFSIYGADCEVRVKSWNTALAYKLMSPFVKEKLLGG